MEIAQTEEVKIEEAKTEEEKLEEAKMEAEEAKAEAEGKPISDMVNQEIVTILLGMGFSKAVSEKALFLTGNSAVEQALDWIDKNTDQPDFEEELRVVGQQERQKLNPEEAAKKARELQERIRKNRVEKDKQMALEQEKDRMRYTKEIAEAKRKQEEQQRIRDLDYRKKEKMELEKEKQKMLEVLKRDKEERFGKKAGLTAEEAKKAEIPPIDRVSQGIKTVKTVYTDVRNPGVANQCLKTIQTYVGNIIKNPEEEKFRRINLKNEAFHTRVGKISGGLLILKGLGFEDEGDFLVLNSIDDKLLKEGHRLLENNI